MNLSDAVRTCFRKYITIDGRARRAEYWWFFLFALIGNVIASVLDTVLFGMRDTQPLGILFSLAIFLPSLAVAIRRLHDRDMSGWWFLLNFVPLIGTLILLVIYALPGTGGPNRFGPDPIRNRDDSRTPPPDEDDTPYSRSSIPRVDRE